MGLGLWVAKVKDEVLMVVPVMVLEVLMIHIGFGGEDTLGCSVGSFNGMAYEKKLWVHFINLLKIRTYAEMVKSECGS